MNLTPRGFDLAMIEELPDHRQALAESQRPGRERMALAAPNRDTAQWSADSLGRSEVEEVAEGYSYGANTIRDGVSLMPRRELRSLALPSEIMRLPNLEGYLKFPGPLPVASIRLKYVSRPAAAERFVPRGQDGGDGAAAVDDAIAVTETAPHEAPERADDGPPAQGELLLLPPPENTGDGAPAGDPAGTAPESDRASPPPGAPAGVDGTASPGPAPGPGEKPERSGGLNPHLTWWPRSAPSPRPPRASPTTRRTTRSTGRPAPWSGRGAGELGLEGPVDPQTFRAVLEGKVPDGSGRALGRRDRDGKLLHRPGRDVTLSAPKSVSLAALVGGDVRVVDAHDRAVQATLAWIEKNAVATRLWDPATGQMVP